MNQLRIPPWLRVRTPQERQREREHLDRLYSPCGCGSGKKFKFCHYKLTTTDKSGASYEVG